MSRKSTAAGWCRSSARAPSWVGMLALTLACSRSNAETSAHARDTPARTRTEHAALQATPSAPVAPPSRELPALKGGWLERLELEGGGFASVTPPVGAREPRPVVVAIHGAGDRPEWACGGWRLASHTYPFVVCPAGTNVGGERFGWASGRAITEATERALAALQKAYGAHVAAAPPVYAGFSQGAILAREVLLAVPNRFRVAVLAEGGYDLLRSSEFASAFVRAGGERVLVVCGGSTCFEHSKQAVHSLRRAGLTAFVTGDPRAGHNLNQRMQTALQATWRDVVRGQPGWESFR